MLFIICLSLIAIAIVGGFIHFGSEWGGWSIADGLFGAVASGFLVAIGAGLIFLIGFVTFPNLDTGRDGGSDELRALGTDSEISGRSYFLGGGYIGEERTLNYIAVSDNGGLSVSSAYAVSSTIYEDATDSPRVDYTEHYFSNGWLTPFDWHSWQETTFHIPADSVLEDYTIENN